VPRVRPGWDHRAGDGAGLEPHDPAVIRNVVIHITNEQPLLADLYERPTSTDASLVCTNVRMLDGKKPIFIDHPGSVFVFPYLHIRFLEIPPGAMASLDEDADTPIVLPEPAADGPDETDVELELDEDFLRRIRDV
jgi:hypothetical protein